ncbi:MAG: sialate O-acetylesterase [Akkermansiaceae bacterium]|nr:sialate O-acetylesterase [Akkermansiaceae bacterium]
MKQPLLRAALVAALAIHSLAAAPLKVYLMAGQSNMQGFCSVKTFPQIEADPVTKPIYEKMVNPDGTPRVIENVWISTSGCTKDESPGQLTTGYGGGRKGGNIGPELTFGIYMQEHVKEPILLIKTAWGGKSLCRDFRPPSAGIHPTHVKALEELRKENKDTAELEKEYVEGHGKYYRMMIAHAQAVLADLRKGYPAYDAAQGYELKGFVWFQGENDFGGDSYPNAGKPGGFDEYTRLLACLIRDVRKDLKAPEMNAVIGVLGFNGELETERYRQIEPKHIPWLREFRKAMAAPADMPEFKGQVAAVTTEEFWEPRLEELQGRWKQVKAKSGELRGQGLSKGAQKAAMDEYLKTVYNPEEWKLMETGVSNACYHYLGSAKIMSRIGKAFAEARIKLEDK